MPSIDTSTQRITVRHSPDTAGHLEVTIHHLGAGKPAQVLELAAGGSVMERRKLRAAPLEAVQLRLDRSDAQILLSMLQEVAYDLPMLPTDHVITVPRT